MEPLGEDQLPTFIYSFKKGINKLWRTNLLTGEESCHQIPHYNFNIGYNLSQLPRGSLLITGGRSMSRIDTLREFAVTHQPPLLTPKRYHCAVYHHPHLYLLGGMNDKLHDECERYVCAEERWEILPPLPTASAQMSGLVVEGSLYAASVS
jgi:hypothetical protein